MTSTTTMTPPWSAVPTLLQSSPSVPNRSTAPPSSFQKKNSFLTASPPSRLLSPPSSPTPIFLLAITQVLSASPVPSGTSAAPSSFPSPSTQAFRGSAPLSSPRASQALHASWIQARRRPPHRHQISLRSPQEQPRQTTAGTLSSRLLPLPRPSSAPPAPSPAAASPLLASTKTPSSLSPWLAVAEPLAFLPSPPPRRLSRLASFGFARSALLFPR